MFPIKIVYASHFSDKIYYIQPKNMSRVGVVGAGISGLACARELLKDGISCVVFEELEHVGGRAETVTLHECTFDTGLQFYTPRGMSIEKTLLKELPNEDLYSIQKPICLLDGYRVLPGNPERNKQPRYCYLKGAQEFPKLLSENLEIRTSTKVESISKTKNGFRINDEDFDVIILTPPAPECNKILTTFGHERNLSRIKYRPCISVVLGYSERFVEDWKYFGLLSVERNSPVLWLGVETAKCPHRTPEGHTVFVAQLSPLFSRQYMHKTDEVIISAVLLLLRKIYGAKADAPAWTYVRRWVYSQPETVSLFDNINFEGSRVLIVGDGTLAGRAENAFETGIMAARRALKLLLP